MLGGLVRAGRVPLLVLSFNLTNIASLGSAVALLVFSVITAGHFRVHRETGANLAVLVVALLTTVVTFVVFCSTTLVDEPATATALVAILALALLMDLGWKRRRDHGLHEAVQTT